MSNIRSTHFKRKRKQSTCNKSKIFIFALGLILLFLIGNLFKPRVKDYDETEVKNNIEQEVLVTKTLQAKADITKSVLEVKASKVNRFIESINNEIEYIVYQEEGNQSVSHSRLDKKAGLFQKFFSKSNIKVRFEYKAVFSIKTSDILLYNDDGTVHIEYNPSNIIVKGIDVNSITSKSSKALFGKGYKNQEVLSLVEIAKDEVQTQLESNDKIRDKACKNLNDYFKQVSEKIGIDKLVINSEEILNNGYTFMDQGTIKHNHSNKALESVKYIVIHSTGVNDIDALKFFNNLNDRQQKRESSAHFFVDDKNVVQCLPTNMQAWHVGCDKPLIDCTNRNSLGVEICQFTDTNRQKKAIDNAVSFVKEVLHKQFPDAEIVMHRQVKAATKCPSILTDEEFNTYFK